MKLFKDKTAHVLLISTSMDIWFHWSWNQNCL